MFDYIRTRLKVILIEVFFLKVFHFRSVSMENIFIRIKKKLSIILIIRKFIHL